VINGPVLLETARSVAREREREREANAAVLDGGVEWKRAGTGVPARLARAWRGLWPPSTIASGSPRRHHVLLHHDELDGW
jgi:hypothetical protein